MGGLAHPRDPGTHRPAAAVRVHVAVDLEAGGVVRGEDRIHTVLVSSAQEDVQTVPGPRAWDRAGLQGGWPAPVSPPTPPSLGPSDWSPLSNVTGAPEPQPGSQSLAPPLPGWVWVSELLLSLTFLIWEMGTMSPASLGGGGLNRRVRGPSAARQQEVLGQQHQCLLISVVGGGQ